MEYNIKYNTFKEADKKASKIFEKENIDVYIFEITILNNSNYPYYIVSSKDAIVISDDCVANLIKQFNPKFCKIKVDEVRKYFNDQNNSIYLIDSSFKDIVYYRIEEFPSLMEYIKYNYAIINSTENSIRDVSNYTIFRIETFEEFVNRNNIGMFNGDFDKILSKLNWLKTLLIKK